jgi:hypothetical protein
MRLAKVSKHIERLICIAIRKNIIFIICQPQLRAVEIFLEDHNNQICDSILRELN